MLDVADLFRDTVTLEIAFSCARKVQQGVDQTVDRLVRREAAQVFRRQQVIPAMIDRIQQVLRMEEAGGTSDDRDS